MDDLTVKFLALLREQGTINVLGVTTENPLTLAVAAYAKGVADAREVND